MVIDLSGTQPHSVFAPKEHSVSEADGLLLELAREER